MKTVKCVFVIGYFAAVLPPAILLSYFYIVGYAAVQMGNMMGSTIKKALESAK